MKRILLKSEVLSPLSIFVDTIGKFEAFIKDMKKAIHFMKYAITSLFD
jgi:hypothetical protein